MVNGALVATTIIFSEIGGEGFFQKSGTSPGTALEIFFSILLGFFTVVAGISFLIYFLVGALAFLTAKGDKQQTQKAQGYMSNALVGLVIVVLAWAITGIVGKGLGFNILNVADLVTRLKP